MHYIAKDILPDKVRQELEDAIKKGAELLLSINDCQPPGYFSSELEKVCFEKEAYEIYVKCPEDGEPIFTMYPGYFVEGDEKPYMVVKSRVFTANSEESRREIHKRRKRITLEDQ